MVGLVLVSHSRSLAEAAVDLIRRTVNANLAVSCSGGIGDRREELGTNAVEIQEAITRVFSEDGVVVLMDLGSAILSAETAKDFLDSEIGKKVVLSSAPLVEGGIAAAVQAQAGGSVSEVAKAARESLLPKQEQIRESVPPPAADWGVSPLSDPEVLDLIIENQNGLHLRPAAALIKKMAEFQGEVLIENRSAGRGPVEARSLVEVTRLQIRKGDSVRFSIASPNPQPLIDSIRSMVADRFGESPPVISGSRLTEKPGKSKTFGVSRGFAIGHPVFLSSMRTEIPTSKIQTDPEIALEIARLHSALKASADEFKTRVDRLRPFLDPVDLEIFEAQGMILGDPTVLKQTEEKIRQDHLNSAAAWHDVLSRHIAEQQSAEDSFFRARAADLHEVEQLGLAHLLEMGTPSENSGEAVQTGNIMVCQDLTPTLAENLSRLGFSGVIQLQGATTSHGAIVARALDLPAIGGAESQQRLLRTARLVAIDGTKGTLWIDPDPDQVVRLTDALNLERSQREEALKQSRQPAVTLDGIPVRITANAGSARDILNARRSGAETVGLFRSEFLFQHFDHEPGEEEQLKAYRDALGKNGESLPITLRMLDVGADKPLKFLTSQKEANPFLGLRGIRLLFANPKFFRAHLRALLRLSHLVPLKLLAPMITDLTEITDLRRLLDESARELTSQNIPNRWPLPLGAMIETPAAALLIDQLLPYLDFLSIGTNDLTQYLLCAERGGSLRLAFADQLHPAVVRICEQVIRKSRESAIEASVCGEMASDAEAIPILLGLGLREFSVTPSAIPETKSLVRKLDASLMASQLASRIASFRAASEVREFSRQLVRNCHSIL